MRDDAVLGRALPLDRGLGPSDGQRSAVDSRLSNLKMLVSQSMSAVLTQFP